MRFNCDWMVVEMNSGQMLEDVKLALECSEKISFYGRPGGVVPTPAEFAKVLAQKFKDNNIDNESV